MGSPTALSSPSARSAEVAPERCPHDRKGVAFYRGRFTDWRAVRGLDTPYPVGRKPRNCADADYLAELWPGRSRAARVAAERYLAKLLPDLPSWQAAIRLVQPLFPGTASWLDSCSDAEGMAPRYDRTFYTYGYRPFSWDAWNSNTVGNPMQMRPGTFIYFYNRALARVRDLGYRLPEHLEQADARSWQSMTAAALAGGYARWSGEDNQHWIASWGRGC